MKSLFLFLLITLNISAFDYLGFYAYPEKKYISILDKSVFNIIIPYGSELKSFSEMQSFLNYANDKNISIIFSLKDIYETSKWYPKHHPFCNIKDENTYLKCIVQKYEKFPAIIGWYLSDEPTSTVGIFRQNRLLGHSEIVKRNSTKVIFIEDFPLPRGKLWNIIDKSSDILMTAIYPIPENSILDVYKKLIILRNKYPEKKLIAVLQVFGKSQYSFLKKNEKDGRIPTKQEIVAMIYLSFFTGADGIIFYSLRDFMLQKNFLLRFNFINEKLKELNKLKQYLLKNHYKKDKYIITKKYFLQEYKNNEFVIQIKINLINKDVKFLIKKKESLNEASNLNINYK